MISELFARYLAGEGIKLGRTNVTHPEFDSEKRVLLLPMWEGLSAEQEEMLVAREVGRALYSPPLRNFNVPEHVKKDPVFFQYWNIVEDARIEGAMMRLFPGLVSTFRGAYQEFYKSGWFKIDGKLKTIDRLNLHAKLGRSGEIAFGLSLTPREEDYYARLLDIRTYEQTVALAYELFEQDQEPAKTPDEKDDEGEETPDESEDKPDEKPAENPAKGPLDTWADSLTDEEKYATNQQAFEHRLEEAAAGRSDVTHSRGYTTPKFVDLGTAEIDIIAQKWKLSDSTAKYLYSVFLRKQRAHVFAHTSEHRSGRLDLKRLSRHKTHDDIFLRATEEPVGQRHGVVLIIDNSGSMTQTKPLLLPHVLSIVGFMRAARIPHCVYAFSSSGGWEAETAYVAPIYSHDMPLRVMMQRFSGYLKHGHMGGTPLVTTMLALRDPIYQSFEMWDADRRSVIFITDGQATDEPSGSFLDSSTGSIHSSGMRGVVEAFRQHLKDAKIISWFLSDHKRIDVLPGADKNLLFPTSLQGHQRLLDAFVEEIA